MHPNISTKRPTATKRLLPLTPTKNHTNGEYLRHFLINSVACVDNGFTSTAQIYLNPTQWR